MASFKDNLDRVYQSANDQQALQRAYKDWAASYDAELAAAGYAYFSIAPAAVARHLPDTTAKILDAGVGTGHIGAFLALLGYRNITGIDLSDDMLAVARRRNVFAELRQMDMGQRLDFPDHHFDAVYTFGAFTTGHAPPHGYRELVRVCKSSGRLILALTDHARADSGYGAELDALSAEGVIERIAQTPVFEVFPFDPAEQGHLARVDVYRIV